MMIQDMIDVMQAYRDGKTIECAQKPLGNWGTSSKPVWNFMFFDYRVKSEPLVRWVNVYRLSDGTTTTSSTYETKEEAEETSSGIGTLIRTIKMVEEL